MSLFPDPPRIHPATRWLPVVLAAATAAAALLWPGFRDAFEAPQEGLEDARAPQGTPEPREAVTDPLPAPAPGWSPDEAYFEVCPNCGSRRLVQESFGNDLRVECLDCGTVVRRTRADGEYKDEILPPPAETLDSDPAPPDAGDFQHLRWQLANRQDSTPTPIPDGFNERGHPLASRVVLRVLLTAGVRADERALFAGGGPEADFPFTVAEADEVFLQAGYATLCRDVLLLLDRGEYRRARDLVARVLAGGEPWRWPDAFTGDDAWATVQGRQIGLLLRELDALVQQMEPEITPEPDVRGPRESAPW